MLNLALSISLWGYVCGRIRKWTNFHEGARDLHKNIVAHFKDFKIIESTHAVWHEFNFIVLEVQDCNILRIAN